MKKWRFSNQSTLTGSLRWCSCPAAFWLTPSHNDNTSRRWAICSTAESVRRMHIICLCQPNRFFFRLSYFKYSNTTAYNIVRFPSVEFSTLQRSVGYCCVVVFGPCAPGTYYVFVVRSRSSFCIMNMCLWCVVIVIARDITTKRVSRLWPVNISFVFCDCVVSNAKTIASFSWLVWDFFNFYVIFVKISFQWGSYTIIVHYSNNRGDCVEVSYEFGLTEEIENKIVCLEIDGLRIWHTS